MICAIDNLGKGAAGQAIQNANLALGLRETAGLRLGGVLVMSVTAAEGLRRLRACAAGIRRRDRHDLAIVRSLVAARPAPAMFTRNRVQAAAGHRVAASTSSSPSRRRS